MTIETKPSSSGQKNMLVNTGATTNNRTERISRWRKPRLRSAMPNQDCSPPLWMGGYNGNAGRANYVPAPGTQPTQIRGKLLDNSCLCGSR